MNELVPVIPQSNVVVPKMVLLTRGPSTQLHKLRRLIENEWAYETDTKRLRRGNASSQHGEVGMYTGGNFPIWVQVARALPSELNQTYVFVLPPSMPEADLRKMVLEEGRIVHCIEENWWYIGDGVTPGGNKAA